MIGIVVSRADYASTHIRDQLLECTSWETQTDESRPDADGGGTYYTTPGFELREFDELHIYLDDPSVAFSAPEQLEFVVFVSRHSGNTGKLLTAHVTGNFGPAEYGGTDGGLARAAPNAQKAIVASMQQYAPDEYDVGIECTHHGPSEMTVPSLFAEVGSDDPQWRDPEAARAVAKAVLDCQTDANRIDSDGNTRHVVGFGGGHYAPRFTRVVMETDWAVGHIGADWQLEELGDATANCDVIDQAFTASNAALAVVEGTKPTLTSVISELGYRVVSETWLSVVGDRSLSLVKQVESELSSIDDGLRFGAGETDSDELTYVSLPDELLSAASGIDLDRTYKAVKSHTVAFETTEGATKPVGRAAIHSNDAYDALIDEVSAILTEKYDSVTRTDGEIVATTVGFDPERASTLGIPEGPKFGQLASGRAIEHGGQTITPETVSTEQVDRFIFSRR